MGKKGKKDFLDLPDPDEEEAASGLASSKAADASGSAEGGAAASAAAGPKPASKGKKDKKKGKGKSAGFDSDDELPASAAAAPPDNDDYDEPLVRAKPKPQPKKGNAKKGAAAAFAMLGSEEEDEVEKPAPAKGKKQPPPKQTAAVKKAAFQALNDEEEEEEDDDEEDEHDEPSPKPSAVKLVIAEVLSVEDHPKADRLKVCEVDAGMTIYKVITNAANVEEGMKVVFAPVGMITPGSGLKVEKRNLKGVDSYGMLCSAQDIGWSKEADGKLVVLPADSEIGAPCPDKQPAATAKKSKKNGKSGLDTAALFAAMGEDGEEAATSVPPAGAEVKKKKKKVKDMDSLFAAMEAEPAAAGPSDAANGEVAAEVPELGEKKNKKKKTKDIDSLFAAMGLEEAAPEPATAPEPKPSEPEAGSAKGKKGGKAAVKTADDDELAALMAELDAPKAAAAAGGKGKKKKKGGGKGGDAEEDLDALLAQYGAAPPAAVAPPAAAAAAGPSTDAAGPSTEAAAEDADDAEAMKALTEGKELTAAQKKRLKKKQKEKESKAEPARCAEEEGTSAAAAEDVPAASKKEKGGKPVKESAVVKRMREALEAKRKADEEAQQEEAERVRAQAEEDRKEEEEEKRKEEERERKKTALKLKRDQLKKDGKLLTGKAKVEAERLSAIRAQMLAQAAQKGIILDDDEAEGEDGDGEKKPKKVVYATKTKQQIKRKEEEELKKKAEEEAEVERLKGLEEARRKVEEQVKAAEAEAAEAAAAAAAAVIREESAGWDDEEAADDWEDVDVDKVKIASVAAAEAAVAAAEAAAAAEVAAAAAAEAKAKQAEEQKAAAAAAAIAAKAKPPAAMVKVVKPLAARPAPPLPKAKLAPKAPAAKEEEEEEEEESEDEEEEGSDASSEGSDDESDDDDDEDEDNEDDDSDESESESESESETDSELSVDEEKERRIEEAKAKRLARTEVARKSANKELLRSPICCILGHVDVGKTKILDNIRRTNVQDGEAGGITQQIGATFVPVEAIEARTAALRQAGKPFEMKLPGLLVIDTPGHESFTNLRQRGSGLCDIAVLIVDLMHGLEQQTIESIGLLKSRKTPFIIALNKVDRMYGWKPSPDMPIRDAFKRQKEFVNLEFEQRSSQVFLQLNEQGLNVSLYWKNTDPRKFVNVVPTSAISGEGIPDLLQLMVKLTQTMMSDRLMFVDDTQCTVLEVKTMEGLGTTVDCVLVNGMLREGDRIVCCGLSGPITTRIKALKTPQVMKEMRVKGLLMDHKEIRAAMGVRVVAQGLEQAVAGTQLFVVKPEDDEEELRSTVMEDMADIFSKVDKGGEGVCVQASTLGALEALLEFLSSDAVKINVSGINIGPVHKKDVMRANVMNEKKAKKFACILAFDVPVNKEAKELAEEYGVKIFTADIIYHLFDQFTAYMKEIRSSEQEAARFDAVFPCTLKIMPACIFNAKDPIVLGVEVVEGIAKVGTPLCIPTKNGMDLGRIASMELNHKVVDTARAGQSVAMKIESTNATEGSRLYGRHFDHTDPLVSRITRESIDALKSFFADEMTKDDWRLVIKLKKTFQVS